MKTPSVVHPPPARPHPRTEAERRARSERQIAFFFGALAVAFAVTGLVFFFFPVLVIRAINQFGARLGFPRARPSATLFWLDLAVSYMVLVTILAGTIARDVRRYTHLIPILAAGKISSSLLSLFYFIAVKHAFLYLLNFIVDGSIAVASLACYAVLWADPGPGPGSAPPAAPPGKPNPRDRERLGAVVGALAPSGGPFPAGAAETGLAEELWTYFCSLHPRGASGLRLVLAAIEYGPILFEGRLRTFTRLDPAERERSLAGWETSRLAVRRQLVESLKLIAGLHFYGQPEVQRSIGYSQDHLRERMLAGPNAEHHRRRLATGREAGPPP